ncbi:MAG: nucleotide sugar epimerase [Candidatus Midichloriaceae bacterium]|jgi:UDP-glucuronate 4-epimerase|nr:nucleotide sugar epimerase [Candidatus Midichloriaceae bacterium]
MSKSKSFHKLASGSKVQGTRRAQDRSVLNIHEISGTGALWQFSAEVELTKRFNILITGVAGFIGFHTANKLLLQGHRVFGVDFIGDYYDPALKLARLKLLENPNFVFQKLDINETNKLLEFARNNNIQIIIHLAAQPGVRYSLIDPFAYSRSNLNGHLSVLEVCKNLPSFERLIYASSSSVYGNNTKVPYSETDPVDSPASLYAATKRSCEVISESYWNLFKIPMIGLRFFTVYGPWGRPDMAPFIFTKSIFEGKPIELFNHGNMERDFTYIDDIVNGVIACISSSQVDNRIYNLGNHKPIKLEDFVNTLENCIGIKAAIVYKEMQQGDVVKTFADISRAESELRFAPTTAIETGLQRFVDWYKALSKNV